MLLHLWLPQKKNPKKLTELLAHFTLKHSLMRVSIIDNDGFLALADHSTYAPFVTEEWTLDQLMRHFVNEMNKGNFLIWRTGYEGGEWSIDFVKQRTASSSFREFRGMINVTDNRLYLTEYADLTMAAAYPDEKIPSPHNADCYIELANGWYEVTIRQLFNPELPRDE